MTEHRERMVRALKSRLIPGLREAGFGGSFPHLRRPLEQRVDHVNLQFYSAGGSFTLNIGRTGPEGFKAGPWKDLPVGEIEVGHIFSDRRRVTPADTGRRARTRDFWDFGPRSYDEPEPPKDQAFYEEIADDVLRAFLEVAEPWFARPAPPEDGSEPVPPAEGWQPGDPTRLARLLWHVRLRRPALRVGVVLGGLEPPLWRWEHWQRIMPAMDDLVGLLPRPVAIRSSQALAQGDGRDLSFGRIVWSAEGNRKWTGKYLEGPEPVHFGRTEFWSPSRSASAKERRAPEMYARLDCDPFAEVQGFALALRRDQLAVPGLAAAADRLLDSVSAALPGSRKVINDRGWAEKRMLMVEVEPLDHPSSELIYRYGIKRPWSRVGSFAAR